MSDLRDRIVGSDDLRRRQVHVPEWGCDVYVRSFTGTERAAWERSTVKEVDGEVVRDLDSISTAALRLAVLTLVDESGARVFPDAADGMEALGSKSATAINRIAEAASEVNALGSDAFVEVVEDLDETPADAGS